MADAIISDLENFGASRTQLVDIADERGPRLLPYLDLARSPGPGRPPVVFEVQGQPRAYVFDGRDSHQDVRQWIRRIAFRGDADWIGVLRAGRLDIFRAALGVDEPIRFAALSHGPFLFPTLVHSRIQKDVPSVRLALLTLLRRSITAARKLGVKGPDTISLVGRALFWRFLVDRRLLDGLEPSQIAPSATSWESCLDNKRAALQTFEWLDRTFNGGLLTFSSPNAAATFKGEVYESVVGNIAHGATADGQLHLQLPAEWREVNFSHVPVGLLSEVYEAFAHEEYTDDARLQSIFYTPRHIAEFVVDEVLAAVDDNRRPRVLDPAVGAGVFLVTAFRALVAREWRRTGEQPTRQTIRRILNRQLVGFDINDDALRLSELALYLTAIELDPDTRPRPLALLRFDELRDHVLFLKERKTQGSLGPVEPEFREKFDVVVGNPPWSARATREEKIVWVDATRDRIRERLGPERSRTFDLPDANPDIPFVYRAMDWAAPRGAIGLVTHARWLFGQSTRAVTARRDLLESVHVTGLLNGTALRDSNVWPNVRHPFCLLFAINEPPPADATIQFISPDLERTPDRLQQHLRIDWNDARDVAIADIIRRPWALKALFRGSSIDESVLDDMHRRGVPLGEYLATFETRLRNGYQVGGRAGKQKSAEALRRLPDLRGTQPSFVVETSTLPKFSRPKLLFPRDRDIYRAPLLLVHESMRVDPKAPRAIISFHDVAYDERFSGISFAGVTDGKDLAIYLQIVFQSSLFVHAALFLDGQFGVEREVVHLQTIERIPVVPWQCLSTSQRKEFAKLSHDLRSGTSPNLTEAINAAVADTYRLSDVQREAVEDTLATALPTATAKANATRETTATEREHFAAIAERDLQDLLGDERVLVRPLALQFAGPWQFLRVDRNGSSDAPVPTFDLQTFIEAADEGSASLVVMRVTDKTTVVGQLDRYRYWTPTRARLLVSSLVSEDQDG